MSGKVKSEGRICTQLQSVKSVRLSMFQDAVATLFMHIPVVDIVEEVLQCLTIIEKERSFHYPKSEEDRGCVQQHRQARASTPPPSKCIPDSTHRPNLSCKKQHLLRERLKLGTRGSIRIP